MREEEAGAVRGGERQHLHGVQILDQVGAGGHADVEVVEERLFFWVGWGVVCVCVIYLRGCGWRLPSQ